LGKKYLMNRSLCSIVICGVFEFEEVRDKRWKQKLANPLNTSSFNVEYLCFLNAIS
jgi:hypothetical protein